MTYSSIERKSKKMTTSNTNFKIVLVKDESIFTVSIVAIPTKTSIEDKSIIGKRFTLLSLFRRNSIPIREKDILEAYSSKINRSDNIGIFESNGLFRKSQITELLVKNMGLIIDSINKIEYNPVTKMDGTEILRNHDLYGYSACALKSYGRTFKIV